MKQTRGLGTQEDHDGDGTPDQPERDFEEAGHTEPQPADTHPEHLPPRRERRDHAA